MKEIKTRQTVKDIRTLDRAANVTGSMKNAYVRTKEQTEHTQPADAESPSDYAENRTSEGAQEVTCEAVKWMSNPGKRLVQKNRQNKHEFSNARAEHTVPSCSAKESRHWVKTMERSAKENARTTKAVKTGARGSIRITGQSVKTAEQTSRAAVKTTQATVKTATKTAQATAKAAQRAAQAARAAARTAARTAATAAKTILKAVTASVKAIIVATKSLSAAIAAGGWVAVVIIVVVLMIAYILCSAFGIFATEKGYNDSPSMPDVVSQINAEFSLKIDSIKENNPHDKLVINNDGSALLVANWNEVLAIYDVLITTDPKNPIEVATLDDAKIKKLKTVFWNMNSISFSVNVVEVGTNKETGEINTETELTITVSCKTAEEMIQYYSLSAERVAQVRELLQPEYAELFMRLSGSYADITLSEEEIAAIIETLPDDLSDERKEVVLTAYSLLGKVRYFWGGKSLVLGWDSRWGIPTKVTADDSPTTGTVRPFGLDCSGFIDWVYYNVSNGEYIIGHGGGATAQYSYCDAISWDSAQPGDLAFYPDCEHAGIVVKNDVGTLTIIHCASGSNNVVMTHHTQGSGFAFVGRPQMYDM